jgi:mRNA interferase MazF
VVTPAWGEIWWGETPDEKPRPYLVLTRDVAIPVLSWILAAPVTSRVRGIPTEVALGPGDGLPIDCAASMDNVASVRKAHLIRRMGALDRSRRRDVCEALAAATDC